MIRIAQRLLLPILLYGKLAHGAVDLSTLSSEWISANPPTQLQDHAKQTGLTLKAYRTHPEKRTVLIHYTASVRGSARKLVLDMIDSLEKQKTQNGFTIRVNEIKKMGGGEVLHQEWQYGNTVEILLCELSENPMYQIRMSCPAENYSQMIAVAQSTFHFPKSIAPSAAYRAGQQMGQFSFWILLTLVAVIIIVWLKNRSKRKSPITPSNGFSLDRLKAAQPQSLRTSRQVSADQVGIRTESHSTDGDKPNQESEDRTL